VAKVKDLRDLSDDELHGKLVEAKEELFNLRFQLVTGQLDNPMRIKVMRKEVARILTVVRERELAVLEGAAPEEA
jgi:large subunit ribosomal protein L29